MTAASGSLSLIFEASISAQMILFAAVQAVGVGRFGPLRGVLALITGSLGLAVALNSLAAVGLIAGLRDLNLFLELVCAAAIYVYVAHAHDGAAPIGRTDALHLLPAALAFAGWKVGLVEDMDGIMLAILATYACATLVTAATRRVNYQPKQLWWFIVLLTASFVFLVALRAAITYEVAFGIAFRDSGAYLALLVAMLTFSSTALMLELRFPNLLSAPSTYVKYAENALSEIELARIDECFQTLMREHKPYLGPEIGLREIAAKLGVQERHLSQLANARYRMNLPAVLNRWRSEEAARQLSDAVNTKPITTIMYDAGFGSKSAFQREFQKRYAMSPTAFRAQRKAERRSQ